MINKLMQIVAPHYCYSCAKVGSPLCSVCKYDISDEAVDACIVCQVPSPVGICLVCRSSYQQAWYVGDRTDALLRLVNAYKFERVKDAGVSLAELLASRLPQLPASTIIVPVPTISAHIRRRGYDHTLLVAQHVARMKNCTASPLLERIGSTVQLGNDKRTRVMQAQRSFRCKQTLSPDVLYLLIDDITTTGATLEACAAALVGSGAVDVRVAVIARQPLDK
jgi:ComF family protein